MSKVLLCRGAYAKNPYYVKEACIHLYSIEELCYFVYHYAFVLDDTFVSSKLTTWIKDELELSDIASKIHGIATRKGALSNLVRVLNNEIGYYAESEWEELIDDIDNSSQMSISARRKIRADGLLKGGRYALALEEYENLLYSDKDEDDEFVAKVYHNLGVCAAFLFMFERAADYFSMAYSKYANTESFVAMLCAKKMYMTQAQYVDFLASHKEAYEDSLQIERKFEILKLTWCEQPAYKYFRELEKQKREGGSYYDSIDRLAAELKDIYRGHINGTW